MRAAFYYRKNRKYYFESELSIVNFKNSQLTIQNSLFHDQLFRFRLSAERYLHKIMS